MDKQSCFFNGFFHKPCTSAEGQGTSVPFTLLVVSHSSLPILGLSVQYHGDSGESRTCVALSCFELYFNVDI